MESSDDSLARELWDAYSLSMQEAIKVQASAFDDLDEVQREAWRKVARAARLLLTPE